MLCVAAAVAHLLLLFLLLLIFVIHRFVVLRLRLVARCVQPGLLVDFLDDVVWVAVIVVSRYALNHAVEGVVHGALGHQELIEALVQVLIELVHHLDLSLALHLLRFDLSFEKAYLGLVLED